MKKVLIALDYNPTAQKVAETGYLLASSMGAETILLHVVADAAYYASAQYSPIMGYTGFLTPEVATAEMIGEDELKKEAKNFLNRSKNHLGDPEIKTRVVSGDTNESILKAASDLKVDIIVVGSHSRRWLEKILMGSIAEKVINHANIPVFIIPTGDKNSKN